MAELINSREHLLGVALSGGGACCAAQIGILQAWKEAGIQPDALSGTSGGAIVGALFAYGWSPKDILSVFTEANLFSLSHLTFRKPGLLDIESFEVLEKYLPEDDFSALSIPLSVSATNLEEGTVVRFSEGPLRQRIFASAAFPGVFAPVKMDGSFYADGGIVESVPIEALQASCKVRVAIDVNPAHPVSKKDINSSVKVINRTIRLMLHQQRTLAMKWCDLYISPKELTPFGPFSMDSVEDLYGIGYKIAKQSLPKLKDLLDKAGA